MIPSQNRWWLSSWHILYAAVLALWLGGLTFYALVVIPVGTERWGSVEQGMLTASVTVRLNWIANVAILLVAIESLRVGRRWFWLGTALLIGFQVWLFLLHGQLSERLNLSTGEIQESAGALSFYDMHRLYLLVTAAQWLLGILFFAHFCQRAARSSASDSVAAS
jgi:hypothetical protein